MNGSAEDLSNRLFEHILMVCPHLAIALIVCSVGRNTFLAAKCGGGFAPFFGQVERARNLFYFFLSGDGIIVIVNTNDFGLQFIKALGGFMQLLLYVLVELLLLLQLLNHHPQTFDESAWLKP